MFIFQYQSAKEMLEAARDLFEAAPKVANVLETVASNVEAEKKKETGEVNEILVPAATEEKVKVVPKVLAGVSMSLIEKIRAKEREKKVPHETKISRYGFSVAKACKIIRLASNAINKFKLSV